MDRLQNSDPFALLQCISNNGTPGRLVLSLKVGCNTTVCELTHWVKEFQPCLSFPPIHGGLWGVGGGNSPHVELAKPPCYLQKMEVLFLVTETKWAALPGSSEVLLAKGEGSLWVGCLYMGLCLWR